MSKKRPTLNLLLNDIFSQYIDSSPTDLSQIYIRKTNSDIGYIFKENVGFILNEIRKNFFNHVKINQSNLYNIILESIVNNISDSSFDSKNAEKIIHTIVNGINSKKKTIAFPISNISVKRNRNFFEYQVAPVDYIKEKFPTMKVSTESTFIYTEDYGDLKYLYDFHERRIESRIAYLNFLIWPINRISMIQVASHYDIEFKKAIYSDNGGRSSQDLVSHKFKTHSIESILKDQGIKNYYNFMSKNSDISSLIFSALTWYNETLKPVSNETKILSLFTALENLYSIDHIPFSSGDKAVNITCLIISKNINSKSSLYKELDNLRNIRNSLIHYNAFSKISSDEVTELCDFVHKIIEHVLVFIKENRITTKRAFSKKILELLLDT